MAPPKEATSLVVRVPDGEGSQKLVKETLPVPEPEAHQAIVKVSYAAQNPTDVQSFDGLAWGDGSVLGCDFSGTVVSIGSSVTRLQVGDVVAGLIWGGEFKGKGAYQEYTVADEKVCFKVPKGYPMDRAATIPLAAATAWMAFFTGDALGIPRDAKGVKIVVWGGASSVGIYAVQLAKILGWTVVTTCSPKNFDYVKSLGADHVFDYRDADVVEKIRKAVPNITYAFDTIGSRPSSGSAGKVVSGNKGAKFCTVRPGKNETEDVPKDVEVKALLVFTAFNRPITYVGKFHWEASPSDHKFAAELYDLIPKWLESGEFKSNEPKLVEGGLDGVKDGFQAYRDGSYSAEKLVYKLS